MIGDAISCLILQIKCEVPRDSRILLEREARVGIPNNLSNLGILKSLDLGEKEFMDILLMPEQFSEKSLENQPTLTI
jgi:hypothetical protein